MAYMLGYLCISLSAISTTGAEELFLRQVDQHINADWELLRNKGLEFQFRQTIEFRPKAGMETAEVQQGIERYWGDRFWKEYGSALGGAGEHTRKTSCWDGTKYRALNRLLKPDAIPETADARPLSGTIMSLPPAKKRWSLMDIHRVLLLTNPEKWIEEFSGYPTDSAAYRRERNVMPPVTHTLATIGDGVIISISSVFADPTLIVGPNGAGFTVKRIVAFDGSTRLPTSFEFSELDRVMLMGQLSWSCIQLESGSAWLLTEAVVDLPQSTEPGESFRCTFSIDPTSIIVGPIPPERLDLRFPPGTRVADRINRSVYVASAAPSGQINWIRLTMPWRRQFTNYHLPSKG